MTLTALNEKAEVQEELQVCCFLSFRSMRLLFQKIFKEGTKKPIGGAVEVRLRVKMPLVKKDVRYTTIC